MVHSMVNNLYKDLFVLSQFRSLYFLQSASVQSARKAFTFIELSDSVQREEDPIAPQAFKAEQGSLTGLYWQSGNVRAIEGI
jgi:hypothetical protein